MGISKLSLRAVSTCALFVLLTACGRDNLDPALVGEWAQDREAAAEAWRLEFEDLITSRDNPPPKIKGFEELENVIGGLSPPASGTLEEQRDRAVDVARRSTDFIRFRADGTVLAFHASDDQDPDEAQWRIKDGWVQLRTAGQRWDNFYRWRDGKLFLQLSSIEHADPARVIPFVRRD